MVVGDAASFPGVLPGALRAFSAWRRRRTSRCRLAAQKAGSHRWSPVAICSRWRRTLVGTLAETALSTVGALAGTQATLAGPGSSPVSPPSCQVDAVRGVEGDRVDGPVTWADFEVQVRAGAAAFVAAVSDELAGLHGLADGDGPAADVAVDGGDAAGVGELDPLAVAAGRPGGGDGAVACRVHRGADGGADVGAGVQPSPARAVVAGDRAGDRPNPGAGRSGAGDAGGRVGVAGHEPADADDVAVSLGEGGHAVVALDGAEAGVIAGQGELDRVSGQAVVGLDGGQQLAHERGLAGDRVGGVERVADAVAVTVDAFTGPRAGHELRQALGADRADGVGVPAGLRLELGGQQWGGDARAGLAGLTDEGLVLGRDDPRAQDTGGCGGGRGVGRDAVSIIHRDIQYQRLWNLGESICKR